MSLETVSYSPGSCIRCGGADGYELASGDVVKIYLNQTRVPDFPEWIEGIVTAVNQASPTDTSRTYTVQYNTDALEGAVALLSECDISSLICTSIGEVLQEQIDAWIAADVPLVGLTYQWTAGFSQVELIATADSQSPGVTIASYAWEGPSGDLTPSGPITQATTLVDGSEDGGYAGGVYTVTVTDSAGHTASASVHVTLDDRLNSLDEQMRYENTQNAANHVDRMIAGLSGSSDELALFDTLNHGGSTYVRNPQFWGDYDLNLTSVSVWNATNAQTGGGVAITPYHIVQADTNTIADGDEIRLVTNDNTLVAADVVDTLELGTTGLVVGVVDTAFPNTVATAKILPADFVDFIDLVGLPAVMVDKDKNVQVFEIASFTDGTITLREPEDATRALFYSAIVTADIGCAVMIFLNGLPVVLGVITSVSLTFPAFHSAATHALLEEAFDTLALCPPNNGGDEEVPDVVFSNSVEWVNVRNRPHFKWDSDKHILGVGRNVFAADLSNAASVGLGDDALKNVTDGNGNTGVGNTALEDLTTGDYNTAVGSGALANTTDADRNTAVGRNAGSVTTTGDDNVFVGYAANPSAAANSNSIVVGANATGDGSNTGVFGDANITTWRFVAGNVGIGITPTAKLHVAGTTIITGITQLTAGTASTSNITGTLVVTGGVGISGAVFMGGNLTVASPASASPSARTIVAGESARAGTDSNTAGGGSVFQSGTGTGTGTVSTMIFQTPTVAGAGTGAQALATRWTLSSAGGDLVGALTVTGTTTLTGLLTVTAGIKGTTTNDSATALNVGEHISSLVAVGAADALVTATAENVTSLSLTAGDWDVEGNVNFVGGSTTLTGLSAGISSTTDTLPTDGSEGYSGLQLTTTSFLDSITLPRKRISLSGTTTVYLVARAVFSAGTVTKFGAITARRVR